MRAKKKAIVELATALIAGSIPFLTGIRGLNALQREVVEHDDDKDFTLFVVIDSETDHLPSTEMRQSCSKSWLKTADKEMDEVNNHYNEQVLAACLKLVSRFDVHA